jgi:hypothetical protein
MKQMKLSLLAIGLLLMSIVAIAEPPIHDYYPQRIQSPSPPPPSAQTAVDDVITILLDQGFAGAIIVILFLWTYRTDKNNRITQKENFDKFVEISAECSANMASVSTRLENIEREIEATKQLEMLQASRKG